MKRITPWHYQLINNSRWMKRDALGMGGSVEAYYACTCCKEFLRNSRARLGARRFHPVGHREMSSCASLRRSLEKPSRARFRPSFIHLARDGWAVTGGMAGVTVTYSCRDCSASNSTLNSAHLHLDEDDELLKYIWSEYLHPKQYEWVLIVGYVLVFLCSLVGNTLGKFKIKQVLRLCYVYKWNWSLNCWKVARLDLGLKCSIISASGVYF